MYYGYISNDPPDETASPCMLGLETGLEDFVKDMKQNLGPSTLVAVLVMDPVTAPVAAPIALGWAIGNAIAYGLQNQQAISDEMREAAKGDPSAQYKLSTRLGKALGSGLTIFGGVQAGGFKPGEPPSGGGPETPGTGTGTPGPTSPPGQTGGAGTGEPGSGTPTQSGGVSAGNGTPPGQGTGGGPPGGTPPAQPPLTEQWPTPAAQQRLQDLAKSYKLRASATEKRALSEELGNDGAKNFLRNTVGKNVPDSDIQVFNGSRTVNIYYKDGTKIYVIEAKGHQFTSQAKLGVRKMGVARPNGTFRTYDMQQGTLAYLRDVADDMISYGDPAQVDAGREILFALDNNLPLDYMGVSTTYNPASGTQSFPPKQIFRIQSR